MEYDKFNRTAGGHPLGKLLLHARERQDSFTARVIDDPRQYHEHAELIQPQAAKAQAVQDQHELTGPLSKSEEVVGEQAEGQGQAGMECVGPWTHTERRI